MQPAFDPTQSMHVKCFILSTKSFKCIFRAIFDFWCLLVVIYIYLQGQAVRFYVVILSSCSLFSNQYKPVRGIFSVIDIKKGKKF